MRAAAAAASMSTSRTPDLSAGIRRGNAPARSVGALAPDAGGATCRAWTAACMPGGGIYPTSIALRPGAPHACLKWRSAGFWAQRRGGARPLFHESQPRPHRQCAATSHRFTNRITPARFSYSAGHSPMSKYIGTYLASPFPPLESMRLQNQRQNPRGPDACTALNLAKPTFS